MCSGKALGIVQSKCDSDRMLSDEYGKLSLQTGVCLCILSLTSPSPLCGMGERSPSLLCCNTCGFRLCSSTERHNRPEEGWREKPGVLLPASLLVAFCGDIILENRLLLNGWGSSLHFELLANRQGNHTLSFPFQEQRWAGGTPRHLGLISDRLWNISPTSPIKFCLKIWTDYVLNVWSDACPIHHRIDFGSATLYKI